MHSIEQAKDELGDEFSFFYEVVQAQLRRLQLDRQVRILDVGTGSGNAAISLALSGYSVLTGEPGDDDSEYAKKAWRERARSRYPDHPDPVDPTRFVQGMAVETIHDQMFDVYMIRDA